MPRTDPPGRRSIAGSGASLKALRDDRGLTQEELAEQAGISASFLAKIENGSRRAPLEYLAAFAVALRVPLADFIPTAKPTLPKGRGCSAAETGVGLPASRTLAEVEALVVELAEAARGLDRDWIKRSSGWLADCPGVALWDLVGPSYLRAGSRGAEKADRRAEPGRMADAAGQSSADEPARSRATSAQAGR